MNRRKIPSSAVSQARADADRGLLLRAGEALRSPRTSEDAAASVAAVLVPAMGDWCFVDLVEDAHVRRLALVHESPLRVDQARAIGERFPLDPEARFGPVVAIRSRATDLVEDIPLVVRQALPEACGLSRVVAQLGIHSRVVVPLTGIDGLVHGALTVAWAETKASYSSDDVPVIEDIGRQLGLVIDCFHVRAALAGEPTGETKKKLARLSVREREVFELVAAGMSTAAIAEKLGLGNRTVETHRVHVLRKLGVKTAVDVVRFAARCGLIVGWSGEG